MRGIDLDTSLGETPQVAATLIVLNGASSSGKSSIAKALQDLWPRPLLVTGIDTYIAGWPRTYLKYPGDDGEPADQTSGLRIVPGAGPTPSWILEAGENFHKVMRLAHRAWAAIRDGDVDQIVDHALFDNQLRKDAIDVLAEAFWVRGNCELSEMARREAIQGDRPIGFASGTSVVVHQDVSYDFTVNATTLSSEQVALEILTRLRRVRQ